MSDFADRRKAGQARKKSDEESTDLKLRILATANLANMILDGDALVQRDENAQPELRDIVRMASGMTPRTDAGRSAWDAATASLADAP